MNTRLLRNDRRPDVRQMLAATFGMVAGLAIFFLLERGVTPRYVLATALDARIPFIAWSWFVYVAFFPFVIALAAYARPSAFAAFKEAVLIAFVLGVVCFLLFPEAVPRPDVAEIGNAFVRHRLARMWQLDLAANGFPSLHVAVTCLACRMLTDRRRIVAASIGLLICVSTLTLKQHTVADVLGGVALAMISALWVERRAWRRRLA
ncbi:MAG: inositol phosphorylceramide synthase [Burkholderia sp.]|jgi:membrane-associated phospholipid phosphatase|nr:phosphatase PAP2 family protein [Burkholderia sp.]MCA3777375.1 inositol phosphorylceramide synthase [Burkholderia sp.]MCA3789489.1 inositol phosphorylceramide synthase [Burkholderia sp.]MCA3794729.1 inositol phosphorylceramide synthase [Burkholderia sp.]MCA3800862.1 inositol phosphorylceramide synthase [Burkholderia sp.]MCA3813816.1 inositol phosphorylceramide synthase [Burkholderia sp.]